MARQRKSLRFKGKNNGFIVTRLLLHLLLITALLCAITREGHAGLLLGQTAPPFLLNDLRGKQVDFSKSGKKLVMLYFFDMDSRPSLEGLNALNKMSKQYRSELAIYAISYSAPERIAQYVQHNVFSFPVLHDASHVHDLYQAKQILPVGCLVGPGLKVVAYYQGGGNSMEAALSKAIRYELQQGSRTNSGQADTSAKNSISSPKLPKASSVAPASKNASSHAKSYGAEGNVGKMLKDNEW